MKTFRITSDATEQPWEGDLEELLEQNPELPEFVVRRLDTLPVGEVIRPPLGPDAFEITRLGDDSQPEDTAMR